MSIIAHQVIDNAAEKTPEEALRFVEAGMNLAGHTITDPRLQELLRQCIYGKISPEACKAAGMRHILARA